MELRLIYGRAGSGKSEFCYNEIAKQKEQIIIITPEQFSATAEKKLMNVIGKETAFNAEVVTLSRMAYRVINEIGGNKKTNLTKCGKAMLVYSILNKNKNALKFLGKTDENIEIAETMIKELKKHKITNEQISEQIEKQSDIYLKNKLQDINKVYEEFENQLTDKYIDETDLLTILANNIEQTDIVKDKLIYIDEFAGFTAQEYDIISKLIQLAKQVTITICIDELDEVKNPDTDIFYSNQITVQRLIDVARDCNANIEKIKLEKNYRAKNEELKFLEKNLYNNKYKKYDKNVENIQLFLAKNQYSEIDNVAKQIYKLVRDEKYHYNEIAIITKDLQTYSGLARAIFDNYNIPVFIDENRDLSQNIVIQYVLSIIEILTKNWSLESVLNYIKTGFADIDEDDIFKLQRYCIKWGIKQNRWKKEFTYGNYEEKDKAEIERLEEIRKQIVEPINELKNKINEDKTFKNISKCLYEFIVEQKIDTKISTKIEVLKNEGKIDLANEYINSMKTIVQVLDEIVLIFNDDKTTLDKYAQILKIGFKQSSLNKIPGTQDQVTMGDVDRSRSHKVKVIFIIGINDGIFPSVHKDEGFLNDIDREMLKNSGMELAKGTIDKLYEDNFNIYKAFTIAEEKLYLSYSSSDIKGKSLRPSMLINKIKKLYPEIIEKSDILEETNEILNEKITYDEMIKEIRKLKEENIEDEWYYVYNYYIQNYSNKLNQDLKGLEYTNEPEQINKENINKLYGNTLITSISKLERYQQCPFSYYLQYGLKIKEQEELKIQTLNTGTFIHEVIDQFFCNVRDKNLKLEEIAQADLEAEINSIVDEKLNYNKNYIFTSTAKYRALVIRLKRIIIKAMKYIIETIVQSRFNVLGSEIEFDEKGKYKPIKIMLEDGKRVEIIGKIDRIDVAQNEDGKYLRIIDYKSSVKNIDLNDVYAGLQIQLLTYLDAACKEEDFLPAGVLYFSLLEQMIKADKKMSEEEIEEKIKANFKMKGLILADVKVVKLHDKNLQKGSSNLVPAYIDKEGNLSEKKTSGVTKEQFADLQKYMYKLIKEISKEILNGKIDLKPYYKDKKTPCQYCNYKNICRFNMGGCTNKYNYINKTSKEEILNKIKMKGE